ncbi:hypothetical protein NPIL_141751 [Nephila pilipes]|uniref:Uncharacterized protein n=1 Tax=Nephila pilipes TaxID=299642 RepID=A0A8X6IEP9_NEPPI|nr:hypothetical protein NPIL_141751 [Nephila pilipes]
MPSGHKVPTACIKPWQKAAYSSGFYALARFSVFKRFAGGLWLAWCALRYCIYCEGMVWYGYVGDTQYATFYGAAFCMAVQVLFASFAIWPFTVCTFYYWSVSSNLHEIGKHLMEEYPERILLEYNIFGYYIINSLL